jgi:hypothetical protein
MKTFSMRMMGDMASIQVQLETLMNRGDLAANLEPPTMANALLAYVPENPRDVPRDHVQSLMGLLQQLCEDMNLRQSRKNLKGFIPSTDRELAFAYNSVINELDEHLFLYIEADRRHLWNSYQWIEKSIRDQFPLASKELLASGSAYSCALATASVFHAMRAAEYGLRSLARERKVKLPKGPIEWGTWEDLINAVRTEAQSLANTMPRGPKRDAVRSFYSGALGQFDAFRDEFRNDVMHVRASYEDPRALQVKGHVCGFLERLAKRTNESGKRIRWT